MQSLKWFFIAVFVAREMLKIQWDRMLGKIVTCFRKHLAFLEERFFFVGCTQHASGSGRCQMETKKVSEKEHDSELSNYKLYASQNVESCWKLSVTYEI